ncbi:hypothetical protein PDIDSM_5022 [Penicillium digitatum]|nr:hypothetical protein PDIDSM_5022 [Penicillium digitatum]
MEAEPTISGSDPSSGNFGTRLACAGGTRSLKNSPSGTDAGQTPTRLIHCRNSNSDDQRSTLACPPLVAWRLRLAPPQVQPRRRQTRLLMRPPKVTRAPRSLPQNPEVFPTLAKTPPTPPTDRIEAVAYLRSLDPKQFVELLELTSFYSRVCTSNSFICFLNKVFWHPPITTHLDPRDPHPHDGRLTRRRQPSPTGYSALAFTNA